MKTAHDVLVVDDEKAINRLICRCVELAGHSYRTALTGSVALREAHETTPNLILLDVMLPDATGFEICQQLRNDGRTHEIPIVLVTALCDDISRQRGMDSGATEYIAKPFSADQMIETIKRLAA